MKPRIVSLFTGVAGLDLAVEHVTGGRVVAHAEVDPTACKILDHHYPDTPNLGDATTIDWTPWQGQVDAICAGFSCFPAGTPVVVKDGMRAIETVREGDLVLTHKGRWRRVVATMRREDAPLLSVTSLGEPGIYCTPEHPFFAKRGRGGQPAWVKARDLTPQDYVGVTLDALAQGEPVEGPAFWYMVGRWLGDGFIADYPRKGRKSSWMRKALICCDKPEADGLAARIAAAGYHATRAEMRTTTTFHITNAELVEFLRPFGRGAAYKLVPEFVFSRSRVELRELWRGWIDADGWRTDRFEQATTVSEQLARGMQRVGEAVFGHRIALYNHQVPPTTVIEGRIVNQLPQWQLRRSWTRPHGCADDDGVMWCQVRSVTPLGERAEVFNFEVEEDNSYVAGRHVVHNCQDISQAGAGKGITDDTRSGVTWGATVRAVRALRPRLVFLENVAAILVRGVDVVAADLAACGLDFRWACVRASDVGAPHRRDRWFAVAYPEGEQVGAAGFAWGGAGRAAAHSKDGQPGVPQGDGERAAVGFAAARAGGGVGAGDSPAGVRVVGRGAGPQRETAADAGCGGVQRRPDRRSVAGTPTAGDREGLQRKRRRDAAGDVRPAAADADGAGPQGHGRPVERPREQPAAASDRPAPADTEDVGQQRGGRTRRRRTGPPHDGRVAWGEFAPAIHRWQTITGQAAPPPTDPRGRLNPDFVEWMVGLPQGWTDIDDVTRTGRLRCLGNIAVPQQAAAAYGMLLAEMCDGLAA